MTITTFYYYNTTYDDIVNTMGKDLLSFKGKDCVTIQKVTQNRL